MKGTHIEIMNRSLVEKNLTHIAAKDKGKTPNPSKWHAYVRALIWEQGSLDDSCWRAALRAASLGLSDDMVFEVLSDLISDAGDAVKEEKLLSQIQRAREYVLSNSNSATTPRKEALPENAKNQAS